MAGEQGVSVTSITGPDHSDAANPGPVGFVVRQPSPGFVGRFRLLFPSFTRTDSDPPQDSVAKYGMDSPDAADPLPAECPGVQRDGFITAFATGSP